MKKIAVIIFAILGLGFICLQQKSYADKKTDHTEYKEMAIKECNSCHKSEGIALNHDADFVRGHRILASKAGNNCSQCHDQKWCLDCHQGGGSGTDPAAKNFGRDYKPKSHRTNWVDIHAIKAARNERECYRCHDAQAFCNSCHSALSSKMDRTQIKEHRGFLFSSFGGTSADHARTARRNLQACQTCHPTGDICAKCHNAGNKLRPFLR